MSDTPTPFTIRAASTADLPALKAFIGPFVAQGKLLPRTARELRDLISHAFLAESGGKIVGFAALEIYSSKLAEIRSLAVATELQGKGIGKGLVQSCVDRAKGRKVLEVMVITSEDNFFKTCGFDFTLPGEKKALFLKTRET